MKATERVADLLCRVQGAKDWAVGLERKFEILRLLVQRRDAVARLTLFCVLVVATACSSGIAASPTPLPTPSPTPVRDSTLFVLVVGDEGSCIAGATVEVTAGQSIGKRMTLTDTCDVWGDASGGEAKFSDLTPDVPMTLRASATGYRAQEMTVVPPSNQVVFALSRSPSS